MSDMHVLTQAGPGEWRVAMHFEVPDNLNAVGKSYREALVNSGAGGHTMLDEGTGVGQITPDEVAKIAAGEVYEHIESFRLESGGTTPAEQRTALRALYAARSDVVLNKLRERLRYFGHEESKE